MCFFLGGKIEKSKWVKKYLNYRDRSEKVETGFSGAMTNKAKLMRRHVDERGPSSEDTTSGIEPCEG